MSEKGLKLPLAKGPLAFVIIAALLVLRFLTIGEVNDPQLEAAIRTELLSQMGGSISQTIDDVDTTDAGKVEALMEMADAESIALHSVHVSKPLLSFGSSVEAIVRVEYTLPGQQRTIEYWRFSDSAAAGWRYRRPANIASYYLNFF